MAAAKGQPLPGARRRLEPAGQSRTIAALLGLWWLATHLGWIKPLFLPRPEAICAR
jgi:taurine transport system permease protein